MRSLSLSHLFALGTTSVPGLTCARVRECTSATKALDPPTRGSFVAAMAAIGIPDSTAGVPSTEGGDASARLRASLFLPRVGRLYSGCVSLAPTRGLSFDPLHGTRRFPFLSCRRASLSVSVPPQPSATEHPLPHSLYAHNRAFNPAN